MEAIAENNQPQGELVPSQSTLQPESSGERFASSGTRPEGRPDWVPEKFYKDGSVDYKAMAQAYNELEKRQSQGTIQPPQAGQGSPTDATQANAEGQPQAMPASSIPGVSQDRVEAFSVELQRDGKLSEGSYAELAQLGYSKEIVNAYVEGVMAPMRTQQAVQAAQDAANVRAEILNEIGGQDVLTDMIGWAKANLTPEEQSAYNDAVFSGNAARVKLAVQGLHSKYSREVGTQPSMHLGGRSSMDAGGYAPFANNDAVVAAMSSPKYQTDPAYRAEVAARLAVSDVFAQSRDTTGQRGR